MNNRSHRVVALLSTFALLLALAASGMGQSTSRSFTVSREATLGGKVVAPGKYTLVFDKDKEGDVSVQKDGRELVKVAYTLNELGKEASDSAVIFAAGADGKLQIRRIEIKGMSKALQFR